MVSREFQTRLSALVQSVEQGNGIPLGVQQKLANDIRTISQEYNEQQRRLQQELDRVSAEKQRLQTQLNDATKHHQRACADRDRYRGDRETLRHTVEDLKVKARKSSERLNEINQNWKRLNEDLLNKITVQDEQLKGKRALWLESNPGSSARRSAMTAIRDPFVSPSTSHAAAFENSRMGSMGSIGSPTTKTLFSSSCEQSFGETTSSSGLSQMAASDVPRGPRRRGNLPTGKAQPGNAPPASAWAIDSARAFNTEPGDTPLASTALVLRGTVEDPSPHFQTEFSDIYGLIEGWVKTYANIPNLANDQHIARSNEALWSFMMNCAYPGKPQDSHNHVMALLNDASSRPWFVMRMAVTFLVKEVLSLEPFHQFSSVVDTQLISVKAKLQERGM